VAVHNIAPRVITNPWGGTADEPLTVTGSLIEDES
jgi:hypothetical protein